MMRSTTFYRFCVLAKRPMERTRGLHVGSRMRSLVLNHGVLKVDSLFGFPLLSTKVLYSLVL